MLYRLSHSFEYGEIRFEKSWESLRMYFRLKIGHAYYTPLTPIPDRTRNSTRLVPIRNAHWPCPRPLHRRHHRHLSHLARHLLASNRPSRRRNALLLLPTTRNHPREARRRTSRLAYQRTRTQDVAVAQPLPRRPSLSLSKYPLDGTSVQFVGVEHVFPLNPHPIRSESKV